jgi:hypothetical protein
VRKAFDNPHRGSCPRGQTPPRMRTA